MSYDAAIVIPIHNEENGVVTTLNAFAKYLTDRFLLVTVDNNSTDHTMQLLRNWQQQHPNYHHKILSEPRCGSMYARRKGLLYAKDHAPVVISSDADNTPRPGFTEDVLTFALNPHQDVLVGHQQQDPHARLLKQLYLPKLMNAIAWMEELEKGLFGPFFFGGYFGVRSDKISSRIFAISQISLPTEPSVIWSKHCYYSRYTFSYSRKTMQTSSRRFWADPQGFFALQHQKIIRSHNSPSRQDLQRLANLKTQEDALIMLRLEHFAHRLLLLLADALFFEKQIQDTAVVAEVISKTSTLLQVSREVIEKASCLSFEAAKKTIISSSGAVAVDVIKTQYHNSLQI